MNKIITFIVCLCCAFTVARAEGDPALNPSDANIVGHVVDRFLEAEQREAPPPRPESRRAALPSMVHRAPEPSVSEELLELLEQRRLNETHEVTETHTVTKEQVNQTEVNNVRQQVVEKSTEDITEMINRTLARQIGTISDRVYGQMERRLRSERARRGWS